VLLPDSDNLRLIHIQPITIESLSQSIGVRNVKRYLMPFKDIAKELTSLLIFAVITAFAVNHYSNKGIAFIGEWDTAQGVISAKAKDNVVVRELEIQDVKIVKYIYDRKEAVFVDARAYEDYQAGHIQGAVSLPVGQFEERIEKFRTDYPTATYIVTYCSGRECDDSHELAQYLFAEGYTTISVFIDGFPVWKREGFPVEPAKPVGPLSGLRIRVRESLAEKMSA